MTQQLQRDPDFESVLDFIKWNRGFDFTGYKRASLMRRFERRMQTLRTESFSDYQRHLESHPDEFNQLFNTILINVTGFFRDAPMWEYVAEQIVPRLSETLEQTGALRIWSAGCSSGEEPFTIGMLLSEALGEDVFRKQVKIYATDVDEDALSTARRAQYPTTAVDAVPDELRERYFDVTEKGAVVRPELRRAIIFGRHDLNGDPPISRVDLLTARNTLMYFEPEAQTRILANFHFALRDSGFLFLGKSEVLMARTNLFTPVNLRRRVFQRVPGTPRREPTTRSEPQSQPAFAPDTREAAFEAGTVSQIVVDEQGVLALANLQARVLFGLSNRDLGRPLRDLDLSYRPADLRSPIDEVRATRQPLHLRGVPWTDARNDQHVLDIHLAPLQLHRAGGFPVSITFADVTRYQRLHEAVEQARQEGETAYEELQATFEELETTNEELQSTNEELETTNEELQAANEELETMNEELQSTNEELEAINDMLNLRTEEAATANAFLRSILDTLDAGVVVLDDQQVVLAWNRGAEELWGVRREETVGQHFMNLDIGLPVEILRRAIRDAVTAGTTGKQELQATNRRGRTFQCAVVVSPMTSGLEDDVGGALVFMEPVE